MSTPSVGAQLKAARVKAGFSFKDVTRVTKIQPWVLEALEQDRLLDTMSPVYAKSFLTTYAKLLRLEPKPLLEQLFPPAPVTVASEPAKAAPSVSPTPAPAASATRAQRTASSSRRAISAISSFAKGMVLVVRVAARLVRAGLIAMGRGLAWGVGHLIPVIVPTLKPMAILAGVLLVVTVVHPFRKISTRTPPRQASVSMMQDKPVKPRPIKLNLQPTLPLELVITAKHPTWISVKADGRLLAQEQLAVGAQEKWQANRQFEVIVARPSQVEVVLNGQSISPLVMAHRGRLAISHTQITPLPEHPVAPLASQKRPDES